MTTDRDTFRIGIVDLMSITARGMGAARFGRLLATALARRQDTDSLRAEVFVVNLDPGATRAEWDDIASFDAVLVTGAEPRTTELRDDPSFALMARILAVTDRATSMVFSCLSAHSALQHLYGLPRLRMPVKRVGALRHLVTPGAGPLTADLPETVTMPHSRWHTVETAAMTAAGVSPLLLAEDGDWALAVGTDGSRHVFLQAHPEYSADTLFREYRRDVRRFLDRTSDTFPAIPSGYLPQHTVERLTDFSARARRHRSVRTLGSLPDVRLSGGGGSWTASAEVLVANWLDGVLGAVHV